MRIMRLSSMFQFNYPDDLPEIKKKLGDGCTVVVTEKKNGSQFVAYAVRHVSDQYKVKGE